MEKDYTKYSFRITAIVIVLLLGISFIPSFSFGDIRLKRANIISDLYEFPDQEDTGLEGRINVADRAFIEEMEKFEIGEALSEQEEEVGSEVIVSHAWDLGVLEAEVETVIKDTGEPARILNESGVMVANASELDEYEELTKRFGGVVPIEDFSDGEGPTVAEFCTILGETTGKRLVRIGFLGDSFIEGDIFTTDVRSQLQEAYGGGGVGFVPFSTPLAQNRPTIKHTFGGWTSHNLIKKKSAPENVRERFFVSGNLSTAGSKAWSRYVNTSFRPGLTSVKTARLVFTNTGNSQITMTVNDSIVRTFVPQKDELPQMIDVGGVNIRNIRIDVENPQGFYGYGIYLEQDRGVGVDNFSIRSNSGLALFGTNSQVNTHIDRMVGYDMIVLQYGLNAMDPEITRYTSYGQQLRKVIDYMKKCFPGSVIVVMGVGDRSTMRNGQYVSMPAVKAMVREQRAAASDCGVAFWDTAAAMGGEGGMASFVRKSWAAKDHTHLSFGGGKMIATEFVKALEYARYMTVKAERLQAEEAELSNLASSRYSINLSESVQGQNTATTVLRIEEGVAQTDDEPMEADYSTQQPNRMQTPSIPETNVKDTSYPVEAEASLESLPVITDSIPESVLEEASGALPGGSIERSVEEDQERRNHEGAGER